MTELPLTCKWPVSSASPIETATHARRALSGSDGTIGRAWALQDDIGAPTAQIVCYKAGIILRLRGYATAGASRHNIFVVLVEQIEPEEFFHHRIKYRYGLAPREAEVLSFVRNNVPTSRIAAELGISPVTVKTYIRQIISKLEVDNLSALRAFVGHQSPL
jgi:DNA-binding CsgD family transcriptional regulator